MLLKDVKKSINDMDYMSLLSLWRNAPSGHPYFQGEIGEYYSNVMRRKREEIGNTKHTMTSKKIGWKNE